ncbi:MAG: hypothetical protein PHS02_00545 [Candidatus ainarchaeum sp.]|nr:hypothetical protein [Candidatus ainarchaeum sp.]
MLKRAVFGLFMLVLLSFSTEFLPERFDRPWNAYGWPGNTSVVDYRFAPPLDPGWDSDVLQYSLDRLQLEKAESYNWAGGNLSSAEANYTKAEWTKEQIDAFTQGGVLPYFVDVGAICSAYGTMNCSCLVLGSMVTCDVPYAEGVRHAIALRIFSREYSGAWKGTMNGALAELETRLHAMNNVLDGMESNLAEAEYAGICGIETNGHEACDNASNFIYAASTNSTAKAYGGFTKLKGLCWEGTKGVKEDAPSIEVGEALRLLGDENDGEIARALALNNSLGKHISDSKSAYQGLRKNANEHMGAANTKAAEAERGELWRITVGPSLGNMGGGDETSVSDRIARAKTEMDDGERALEDADSVYAYGNEGYLSGATGEIQHAVELLSYAETDFDQAEQEAGTITESYGNKADQQIRAAAEKFGSGTWPAKATALYAKAAEKIEEGKLEEKTGLKFEYYVAAIEYAKEIQAIDPASQPDTNWTAIAACKKTRNMLDNAKKDSVDVSYEESWFAVASRSNNATELIEECGAIGERVVENARYKYSGLEDARTETVRLIVLCGTDCSDLEAMLESSEKGVVSQGRVLYPDAVGSLAMLEQRYAYLTGKAQESIGLQVGRYLRIKPSFFSTWASLDQASENELDVEITNTVEYAGNEVQASFNSPLEFSAEDEKTGNSNLRGTTYLTGKMTLYLRQIGPLETQEFIFKRNETVLRTLNLEKKAFGNDDGSANAQESRIAESTVAISGFFAPPQWETLAVDGADVALESGFASWHLDAGRHSLDAEYVVLDAYETGTYQNASNLVGQRVYQKYDDYLKPKLDMDQAVLYVSLPDGSSVRELDVISLSGERLVHEARGGGVGITIYGLKKGKEAKYEISYYIDNSSSYLRQEIEALKGENLSAKTMGFIYEAEALLDSGDVAGAAVKIKQAYGQMDLERAEQSKLQKEYDAYFASFSAEIRGLDQVVDGRTGTEFKDQLVSRQKYLKELNATLEGESLDGKVATLRGYDVGWIQDNLKAYKKNASTTMNRMKAAYLGIGEDEQHLNAEFADLQEAYNKLDASGSLDDAYELDIVMAETRKNLAGFFGNRSAANQAMLEECASAYGNLYNLSKAYLREYDAAKGSRFESMFPTTGDELKAFMKQVDGELKKGNWSAAKKDCQRISVAQEQVAGLIEQLDKKAEDNYDAAKALGESNRGQLSEKNAKSVDGLLSKTEDSIYNGERVMALKNADAAMKELSSASEAGNYDIVLWGAMVLVLATAVVYYFKGKPREKAHKTYRKLEKAV